MPGIQSDAVIAETNSVDAGRLAAARYCPRRPEWAASVRRSSDASNS